MAVEIRETSAIFGPTPRDAAGLFLRRFAGASVKDQDELGDTITLYMTKFAAAELTQAQGDRAQTKGDCRGAVRGSGADAMPAPLAAPTNTEGLTMTTETAGEREAFEALREWVDAEAAFLVAYHADKDDGARNITPEFRAYSAASDRLKAARSNAAAVAARAHQPPEPAAWNAGGMAKADGYYWLMYPKWDAPRIEERYQGYIFHEKTLWFGPLVPPDEDAAPTNTEGPTP